MNGDAIRQIEGVDLDRAAGEIAKHLHKLTPEAASSELVYSPTGPHSFYRDMLAVAGHGQTPGAQERLDHHCEQVEHVTRERRAEQQRRLRAGGLEVRVEPDRTDGTGGYFSPPVWLNQLFATANRTGRVLSGLMARFPLPLGQSQVNLPIISTGTVAQTSADASAVSDQDITDTSASSQVVPIAGQADVSLQLLEQSPAAAHADWAFFQDLSEAYDYNLEQQLLAGVGGTGVGAQLLGLINVTGIITVPFVQASPTGELMDPSIGKAFGGIGDLRLKPPQCWLMRSARWAWFMTSEDNSNRPFGLSTPFYIGNDDDTPDPISGFLGIPVFLDDAIPATLTATVSNSVITTFAPAGGTQDVIIAARPHDLILLEGEPQTIIAREPLSGEAGVRLQMHNYAAALTGRRPAGIAVIGGTGMAIQTGF